jgi:hypothetical protein
LAPTTIVEQIWPDLPQPEALVAPSVANLGNFHGHIASNLGGDNIGAPILWCSSQGSTILQIKNSESDPFCQEAPSYFSKWKNQSLSIYTRIKDPLPIQKAHLCSVKKETNLFYTNLLGDKFLDAHIEFEHITAEECRNMVKDLQCQQANPSRKMIMQSDHFWATSNRAKIEFPGNIASLWKREQTSEVKNCAP